MLKIKLDKPVKNTKGEEIKELEFDFSAVTGNMILNAEKAARTMGDTTPDIVFSSTYQLILAAKVAKVPLSVLKELPGNKVYHIINGLKLFLMSKTGVQDDTSTI